MGPIDRFRQEPWSFPDEGDRVPVAVTNRQFSAIESFDSAKYERTFHLMGWQLLGKLVGQHELSPWHVDDLMSDEASLVQLLGDATRFFA